MNRINHQDGIAFEEISLEPACICEACEAGIRGMCEMDCKVQKASRFLDSLIEFLSDCSDMTDDELRAELEAEGVDVDRLDERVEKIVREGLRRGEQ